MVNKLLEAKKKIFLYGLTLFIIMSFINLMFLYYLHMSTNKIKETELIGNEKRVVDFESNVFFNKINVLTSDVLYISDTYNLHRLNSEKLKEIEKEWISFSDRRGVYDQIRFIDIDGDEKIRINYSKTGSKAVSENELQNKKDKNYFKDTIDLKKNQVYISKMDLNIENNQIEQPIKPMIRFSTPVYDENNKVLGIIVLNYYADHLLESFEDITQTANGDLFLLDSNGEWIINNIDNSKEWSFMYNDKKDISFRNEYYKEWEEIKKNRSGSFKTENGYFSYSNIIDDENYTDTNNSIILGNGNFIAVSYLSNCGECGEIINGSIIKLLVSIFKEYIFAFVSLFFISLILGIFMTANKLAKDKIKYFSEYDAMTGVYNRRAGYELLLKSYREITDNSRTVSICFIDINGLKEVNDSLGHEAGDELILTVVDKIKKNIMKNDYVIRLGGDEFLIVFANKNENEGEEIWRKIHEEFKVVNENENRNYIISASHGIAEFQVNSNKYVDDIINIADEKMYNEKRLIKKDLKVLKI